ncbi:MAG: Dabb family protein [Flavihumibacter sp.]
MKKSCFLLLLLTIALTMHAQSGKQLRHVVLFKFKTTATEAQIKTVEAAFRQLPAQIKTIKGFEWGTNNSPEGLNEGLTHCFFVTFASEKDRNDYLPHPAHKAFVEKLDGLLDKAVVVDYWATDQQ